MIIKLIIILSVVGFACIDAADDGVVQVIQQGFSQTGNTINVVFEIKNLTSKKIQIRCTDSGTAMIDYYLPNGNGYSKIQLAYCGVGATDMIVEPGKSGFFPVDAWSVKEGKAVLCDRIIDGSIIGLSYVLDGNGHANYVLSDVVSLRYVDAASILDKR